MLKASIKNINIAGIALVLGIFALVGRKISLRSKVLKDTELPIFLLSIVPFLLVADGLLSRIDGVILVLIYLAFLAGLAKKEAEIGHLKKQIQLKKIWKDALLFILALTAMLLSARWLVFSSIEATIPSASIFFFDKIVQALETAAYA